MERSIPLRNGSRDTIRQFGEQGRKQTVIGVRGGRRVCRSKVSDLDPVKHRDVVIELNEDRTNGSAVCTSALNRSL